MPRSIWVYNSSYEMVIKLQQSASLASESQMEAKPTWMRAEMGRSALRSSNDAVHLLLPPPALKLARLRAGDRVAEAILWG
jgi:hypothetical protein